jgi:hypothetical protein
MRHLQAAGSRADGDFAAVSCWPPFGTPMPPGGVHPIT